MAISVLLHTSDFRGDHAADIVRAVDLEAGETVEALVTRLLYTDATYVDWIELRRVEPLPGAPRG